MASQENVKLKNARFFLSGCLLGLAGAGFVGWLFGISGSWLLALVGVVAGGVAALLFVGAKSP